MLASTKISAFAILCFTTGCETSTAQKKLVVDSSKNTDRRVVAFLKQGLGCKDDEEYIIPEGGSIQCVRRDMIAGL